MLFQRIRGMLVESGRQLLRQFHVESCVLGGEEACLLLECVAGGRGYGPRGQASDA